MTPRRNVEDVHTFADLIHALPAGGSFFLFVNNESIGYQLLPLILRSLGALKGTRVITGQPSERVRRAGRNVNTVSLPAAGSFRKALAGEIRHLSRGELLILDLSGFGPGNRTALAGLLKTSAAVLSRRKRNALWLLPVGFAPLTASAGSSRSISARVWEWGPSGHMWLQLLSFPGPAIPDLFVPRVLSLEGDSLVLEAASPLTSQEIPAAGAISPRRFSEDVFLKSVNGIVVFDFDGSFRMTNPAGLQITGHDEQTFRTASLRSMIIPGEWYRTLRFLSTLRGKRKASAVLSISKTSGRVARIQTDAFLLGDGVYCAFLRDVSGTKAGADHRKAQTEMLQEVVSEHSTVPFALFEEKKLIAGNKAFEAFAAGLDKRTGNLGQLLGRENRDLAAEILSADASWETLDREVDLKAANGGSRTVRLQAGRLFRAGKLVVHCFFTDITAERATIRNLSQLSDQQQYLLREATGALLIFSGSRVMLASEQAASLLGYPSGSALAGQECEALLAGKKGICEDLLGGKWTSSPRIAEFTAKRKDEQLRDLVAVAVKTTLGTNPIVALSITDVSSLREQEEQFRKDTRARSFLLEIDRSFSSSADPGPSIEAGLGVLLKELRFDTGAVYLLRGEYLVDSAVRGIEDALGAIITGGKAQEGFPALVLKTGEPLIIDISQYPAHLPHRSLFQAAGYRHVICIPLRSDERIHGLILLCSRKAKAPAMELSKALGEATPRISRLVENALQFERVRKKEQDFRNILEGLPDIAYRVNHHGALTYISPKVEALLNYRPSDFTTAPDLWRQVVHPDDKAVYSRRVSSAQEKRDHLVLEYRVLPRGRAEYRWIRDHICYTRDEGGALISATGSVRDMTDERRHIGSVDQAGEMRANVLESIREGVAVYDADLRCRDWNSAMEEITGLSRSSVIGLPIGRTTIRVVSLELVAMLQSALNGQTVSSDDIIMNTGDVHSREAYYWVRCFPLKGEKGAIKGVVLTFTDVTARRALEQSVRESEETLRNVIDGMGDALMISDLQGRVWEVNKEFTRITGYSRRDVLGMSFPYPWLVEEEMARFVSWIAELRERSFLRDFDMTWHSQDGRKVAISINTSLLRNASGEPVAMLNIARDISDRKKLMTELERRNRELETLNAISASITTSLHLDEVLQRAGDQIRDVMSSHAVLIYLKDPRENRLLLGCHTGLSDEEASTIRELHPSESATGSVITGGTPLLIRSGLRNDPRITEEGREILRLLDLNSLGVIPLRSKGHVLGALDVGFREEHDFTEEEQKFLALIGAQLGSAIENAQLYDEVSRQVRRLTTLYEVGRGLAGSLDLRTILSTVYGEVSKAIPADRFTYYVYSGVRDSIQPLIEFGKGTDGPAEKREEVIPAGTGPFREAIARNGAVYFPTADGDPALLIAPVRSGQSLAGFLVVRGSSVDLADEAHLRLLESIATLTELALDKASLYVDIVNKSKQIESRNKELDDFTYVVSHDLKEPLISIEGYSKILLREFEQQIGGEGKEYLASLVNSSTRLKNLIDDLLTLSRLGRVTEVSQDVSLKQTVGEVLQDLQFTIRERHVIVEVGDNLPVVRYNPTQLSIVIRNLISNAIKFNRATEPRISIACAREPEEFVVSVSDNGIGIESEYFEKIFMIFQRLHRTEEYRGTGAGLTIVKKIVENHGGTVRVRSTPGEGSTFSFTIPVRTEQ
jgi:PAS domain S-box-containing protein